VSRACSGVAGESWLRQLGRPGGGGTIAGGSDGSVLGQGEGTGAGRGERGGGGREKKRG